MKLKFNKQAHQTFAVESVVDCFAGQPKSAAVQYDNSEKLMELVQ